MERQQKQQIMNDLKKKMVFITGPRQVGKTWLAKDIARLFPGSVQAAGRFFSKPGRISRTFSNGQ